MIIMSSAITFVLRVKTRVEQCIPEKVKNLLCPSALKSPPINLEQGVPS